MFYVPANLFFFSFSHEMPRTPLCSASKVKPLLFPAGRTARPVAVPQGAGATVAAVATAELRRKSSLLVYT